MDITVFTSSTCPHCTAAKEFLKEKGVAFTERNVSEDAEARSILIEKGYRGVPVISVDGQDVVGFDREKLEALLNA